MFCEQCMPEQIDVKWTFENGTYKVLTNIFTLELLKEMIYHAQSNSVDEIYIDTLTCETHGCEICFAMHIRSKQEHDEYLQSLENPSFSLNEFF
jgi:hypothetical protein